MSNESFSFTGTDGSEPFSRENLLKSTGVPISTPLLKHNASKCLEHKAKYSVGRPVCACESLRRSSIFVFLLGPLEKCAQKCQVCCNGFCSLLYLAICNTVLWANFLLLFLDLAPKSISLVLQSEVKRRMVPS